MFKHRPIEVFCKGSKRRLKKSPHAVLGFRADVISELAEASELYDGRKVRVDDILALAEPKGIREGYVVLTQQRIRRLQDLVARKVLGEFIDKELDTADAGELEVLDSLERLRFIVEYTGCHPLTFAKDDSYRRRVQQSLFSAPENKPRGKIRCLQQSVLLVENIVLNFPQPGGDMSAYLARKEEILNVAR